MRERLLVTIMVISIGVMMLAGCGSKSSEAVNVDAKAVADQIKNDIEYKDELMALDLEKAKSLIDFGDAEIVNAYVYETAGATTEEIVVVECKDSANADKAIEALKSRVKEQIETYADYAPDEVVKLKAAYIAELGNVAILSVSDSPEKAKEIVTSFSR